MKTGDTVYVPAIKLGRENDQFALTPSAVTRVTRKFVWVDVPGGTKSVRVNTSSVFPQPGILLVRLGDFHTEGALLDPLTKSLLQFCRLMLPDDLVRLWEVRSMSELQYLWSQEQTAYSNVVFVGHGRRDAIRFGASSWMSASELTAHLASSAAHSKLFVSLCCETGYQAFGGAFSDAPGCAAFVAPFKSVHGAIASQFCQTLLAYYWLRGMTLPTAFRHARRGVPGGTVFRLWEGGQLIGGR